MTPMRSCCDLKTAVLIIGFLFVAIESLYTLMIAIFLYCLPYIPIGQLPTSDAGEYKTIGIAVISIALAAHIIGVILNVSLIYGTTKESRLFVLPWLTLYAVFLAIFTIFSFASFGLIIGSYAWILLLCAGIMWFSWYCVCKFYRSMNLQDPYQTLHRVEIQNPSVRLEHEMLVQTST